MRNTYIPEIKICGITNLDDAIAAMEAGADYLGFVLYAKSPRAVSMKTLRCITGKVGGKIKTVGVFVNESAPAAIKIASDHGFDFIQLCGEERQETFRAYCFPVWRVVRLRKGKLQPNPTAWPLAQTAIAKKTECITDRYVLDSAKTGLYGGTGATIDWYTAAKISAKYKIMLAGGLTPNNVSLAVGIVKPFGLDVSSGVESKPGKKDPKKIRNFIEAAKCGCYNFSKEKAK